ncbi:MAG: SPFH domain-containing protein, partial [Patescibacteria group bacterium]
MDGFRWPDLTLVLLVTSIVVFILAVWLRYRLGRRRGEPSWFEFYRRPPDNIEAETPDSPGGPPTPPALSALPSPVHPRPRGLSLPRWLTLVLGAVITMILCVLALKRIPYPFNVGIAIVAFSYFGVGGLIQIDIANKGVPLLLAGRLGRLVTERIVRPDGTLEQLEVHEALFTLNEGWSWLLPRPLMAAEEIDVRERTSKIEKFVVFAKNGVRISVDATIQWKITNPYQSLSVGEEVIQRGMIELIRQVVRAEIIQKTDEKAVQAQVELRDELTKAADAKARDWGVDITNVLVAQILPSEEVIQDYERVRREERQRDAEIIELEHVRSRIEEVSRMGFSLERAQEIVQTERGKVKKEIREQQLSIPAETRATLKEVLIGIF